MDAIRGKIVSKGQPIVTEQGSRLWQYGIFVGTEIGFCWSNTDYKIGEEVGLAIGTSTKDHKFNVRIVSLG